MSSTPHPDALSYKHFWWMDGDESLCVTGHRGVPRMSCWPFFRCAPPSSSEKLPVRQAAYSLDCFLKDYGADGCCSEGAQYYRHAGLTMFNALDLVQNRPRRL